MKNWFKVMVDGNHEFEITSDDILEIDALQTSPNSYHILNQNKSFAAEITKKDFYRKNYGVNINNSSYAVVISDGLDLLISDMGFALSSAKDIDSISAPMPGLILEIHVQTGQEVSEDDPLLILEAMKMETVVVAPVPGTITAINVAQGDVVAVGDAMVSIG